LENNILKNKNYMRTLFIIIFAFVIVSCKKEPQTITFWHFQSEPQKSAALKEIIREFEESHNCIVQIKELDWLDGNDFLHSAFANGSAPDVIELGSDWVAQFSDKGLLLELNRDSMNLQNFLEFSLSPCFWQGKTYCTPWIVDTRVLFYNKSAMKEVNLEPRPPKTILEMLKFSQDINNPEILYAFGANGSDPHRLYKKILYFMWTMGGNVLDSAGVPILNSSRNAIAFNLYQQLARQGKIETQRQLDADFIAGRLAFWISGSWLIDKIKKENPSLDFDIALLPGEQPDKPGISFAGAEYLAVNSSSKKPGLAKEFIKFLSDGKSSVKYCKKFHDVGLPADKRYFTDPSLKEWKYREVFAEELKHSRVSPVHPQWLEMEQVIESAIQDVLIARSGPFEAVEQAQEGVLRMLKRQQKPAPKHVDTTAKQRRV
jgi:multiple sugar transport system substrate-binding protein